MRQVRSDGSIKWGGRYVFVSMALAREPVGIAETPGGPWVVRFADLELGLLERGSRKLLPLDRKRRTWTNQRGTGKVRRVTSAPWKIGVGPQRVAPPAPRRFRRGGKRGKRGGPRFLDSGITRVAARLWVRGDAVSGACSAWPAGWFGWLKAGRRPSPNSVALASARRQGAARLLRFAPALRVPWRSARAFYGGVMAGSSDPASSRVPSPAVASRWRWPSASAERAAPSGSRPSPTAMRKTGNRQGLGRQRGAMQR